MYVLKSDEIEVQIIEDQKELVLFSKIFGVSQKYKFRLTLTYKKQCENAGIGTIFVDLSYCGDLDINLVEFLCVCKNLDSMHRVFGASRAITYQEENFLHLNKSHRINAKTVALSLEFEIKVRESFGASLLDLDHHHSLIEL